MIWSSEEISVAIEDIDDNEIIAVIETPAGTVKLMGTVTVVDRELKIDGAHVQGLWPGALGIAGLRAIGQKLMEEVDADKILAQGGIRTTGCHKGKRPSPIRRNRCYE
jgi:hypothetical protein